MKRKHRNLLFGAAVCLLAAAAALPLNSHAADNFIEWNSKKKGEAVLSLQLTEEEEFDEASTFQIRLGLTPKGHGVIEECEFEFNKKWKKNQDIVIQEFVYDDYSSEAIITVSARKENGKQGLLNKKQPLELGTLKVTADEDVLISVHRDKCGAVDEYGIQRNITDFGNIDDYVLKITSDPETSKPDETPEEPETPESSKPGEKPEEPETQEPSKPAETPGNNNNSGGSGSGSGSSGSSGGGGGSGSGGPGGGSGGPSYRPTKDKDYTAGPGLAIETRGTWEAGQQAWKFKKENGAYARNEWIHVNGFWYRFGDDSLMKTNWYEENGVWFYLRESGAMKTGWLQYGGSWYYLGERGDMKTGWREVDGKWYYLNPVKPVPVKVTDPATGEVKETTEGQMPYGAMYVNTKTPDGYQVDAQGVWMTNIR